MNIKEKANKSSWLYQLVDSNALNSGDDFSINKDGVPLEKQEEIFNELIKEKGSELNGLDDKTKPNNLIYNLKNENSLKDFRVYRNFKKLFKKLRVGNVT